jgi:hypothetical protein
MVPVVEVAMEAVTIEFHCFSLTFSHFDTLFLLSSSTTVTFEQVLKLTNLKIELTQKNKSRRQR